MGYYVKSKETLRFKTAERIRIRFGSLRDFLAQQVNMMKIARNQEDP